MSALCLNLLLLFFLSHTSLSHGKTHSNKETGYTVFREASMGSVTTNFVLTVFKNVSINNHMPLFKNNLKMRALLLCC